MFYTPLWHLTFAKNSRRSCGANSSLPPLHQVQHGIPGASAQNSSPSDESTQEDRSLSSCSNSTGTQSSSVSTTGDCLVQSTYLQQSDIDWEQFLQGRFSSPWAAAVHHKSMTQKAVGRKEYSSSFVFLSVSEEAPLRTHLLTK
jgi:hypothetical protein